jgi:hypothetical protein
MKSTTYRRRIVPAVLSVLSLIFVFSAFPQEQNAPERSQRSGRSL